MHVAIIQAGSFLARLGRPEVQNCIEGLEQYSYAYEETKELSQKIRREYEQALIKGPLFLEMSSAVPRRTPPADTTGAKSPANGNGNGVHHAHRDSTVRFPSSLVLPSDPLGIVFHHITKSVSMLSIPYFRLSMAHQSPCITYHIIIRSLNFAGYFCHSYCSDLS
jgi:hypothetical protein